MLRRLTVLFLLLVPAPLAAQFTPITAPASPLWMQVIVWPATVVGVPSLYLLDSAGARGPLLWTRGTSLAVFLDMVHPGDQFGIEFAHTAFSDVNDHPSVSFGSLSSGYAEYQAFLVGPSSTQASIRFALTTTPIVTPEPMTIALLATGLVGLGAVGWRRRRRGAV